MKVEIFVEVQATKPLAAGGETYDTEAPTTWKLQDSLMSDSKEIIAAFLVGVAEDVNPLRQVQANRQTTLMHSNWKITVVGDSERGNPAPVIAELITKKPAVAGSMLRGTAQSICPTKHSMRGMDE
jgi:hypothetical protein